VPEYLAPGVYVEETSFRSKSIEGVSTSTSAFAGPARKGPIGGKPVFVTSFAEFERIYGGLTSLGVGKGVNYLAHAVRAYFDNGGARLYISRVYEEKTPGSGAATSSTLALPGQAAKNLTFKARFPGDGLKGKVSIRLQATPASKPALERAPAGTFIRTGGQSVAKPAAIEGGTTPFFVEDQSKLTFRLGGAAADTSITFSGKSAEVTAQQALAGPVTFTAADNTLVVTLSGVRQTVTFPTAAVAPEAIKDTINTTLRGGYARLDANKIVIGSDKRGRASSVSVEPNPKVGFTAALTGDNSADATMLPDLNNVSVQEINALLSTPDSKVRATSSNGRLLLVTTDTGDTATLTIQAAGTASKALGLTTAATKKGEKGDTPVYYVKQNNAYRNAQGQLLDMSETAADKPPNAKVDIVTLSIIAEDADGNVAPYDDVAVAPEHPRYLGTQMAKKPTRRADELEAPYWADIAGAATAFDLFDILIGTGNGQDIPITGGDDGNDPGAANYEAALALFESYEDISIVATPGGSSFAEFQGIMNALISHADKRRMYRIAVVDTPPDFAKDQVRELRGKVDSTHAALYYPWVVVPNPLFRPGADDQPRELTLPPSGFVCGIYARNDIEQTVAKAPANEIVRGALRFETDINFATQEVLNPLGINCLRYLSGRGYRVWGARTVSSDPEWKYVNVRRYFNFLEASIDRGTQWAVFENNGERLWENIRETIEGFLYNEWVSGNLLGETPEQAYFVRCDRSTMTQNDLDNGRLICLVGVAALKPAEFVIFRIGQKTLDSRD
jgi:phage tail sheath protein FI